MVAIDGKSLSCAFEAGARATPLHLVTAWAADQRLVLAQRRAPGRSETTAALEVVAMLDLLGATVNPQAMRYSLLLCPLACALGALLLWRGSRAIRRTP